MLNPTILYFILEELYIKGHTPGEIYKKVSN